MYANLVEILPWDPVAGATVAVRGASHDDARITSLAGVTWWPCIARGAKLTMDLFDGAFGGAIASGGGSLSLAMSTFPFSGRYIWGDARVRIWTGNIGDAWGLWNLRFDGKISNQPTMRSGRIELALAVDDRWLDNPLLATYGGTGGSDGPSTWKGKPKPLALGAPKFVSADLVDATNNVVQLSGYGTVNDITAALDRLSRFSASYGDYANYAALVAASVPAGRWATCKAEGLARLGAPPAGLLSFLINGDAAGPNGWARKPGQLIRRIALIAGATSGQIDDTSLNALDTACPWNMSLFVSSQTTARDLIQQIAASVNAGAGVSWLGKLFVAPVAIGGSAAYTLRTDGTMLPPVASVEQLQVGAPFWRWATEGDRTWTVHGGSDIAYSVKPNDRGLYSASTVYRDGDVVWLANGSQWQYLNPTPASGHTPPDPTTSDSWWTQMQPAQTAAALVYASGASIESLKPAEAGANVTETRVASAIAAQGPWATTSQSVAGVITPGANLIYDGGLRLRAQSWSLGSGWSWSAAPDVGPFVFNSTVNGTYIQCGPRFTAAPSSPFTVSLMFGGSAFTGAVAVINWYDSADAFITAGSFALSAGGYTRQSGTLNSPAGAAYGRLYLYSGTISSGGYIVAFRIKCELGNAATVFTDEATSGALYGSGATIDSLQPAEAGANVTSTHTAAAIASQGAFATLSSAAYGSSLLTGFGALSPLGAVYFGSPYVLETSGGSQATLVNFKTPLGTAAAIASQGAFATLSSAAYGSSLLTGFGALSPLGAVYFGSSYVLETSGGSQATLVNFKTPLGTAAGISGQGPWATAPDSVSSIRTPGQNIFPYPRPIDPANKPAYTYGWAADYMIATGTHPSLGGGYYSINRASVSSTVSNFAYFDLPIYPGAAYSLSLCGYNDGAATLTLYGQYLDAPRTTALTTTQLTAISGSSPQRWGASLGVAPAGAAWIRVLVYCNFAVTGSYSGLNFWGIKLETGSEVTPYNENQNSMIGSRLLLYDNLTTAEALRPAEYGSNVTETRTAAAIASQGAFATLSSAAYGSSLLTGFGALSPLGAVYFGSSYMLETSGGSQATLANFKTTLGTAAAISGQGALATQSSATWSTQVTGTGKPADNADVTGSNTAAAISGQGAFATLSSAAYGSSLLTGFGALSPLGSVYFGSSYVLETSGGSQATLANFKTTLGVAAAISGQGALATVSVVTTALIVSGDVSRSSTGSGSATSQGTGSYIYPSGATVTIPSDVSGSSSKAKITATGQINCANGTRLVAYVTVYIERLLPGGSWVEQKSCDVPGGANSGLNMGFALECNETSATPGAQYRVKCYATAASGSGSATFDIHCDISQLTVQV